MTNSHMPNELLSDVDKPLSLSSRVLSQAEGLGVDFYTLNFVRLACSSLHIAPQGQRLFNHCFSDLPVFRSVDNRLQFGWSDRHLLRNQGVQLYEYEHLLLASALGEFFSDDYSAAVFSALCDYFEQDDRPKPHLKHFRNFVRAANGMLSTSEFPIVLDDRVRMNPYYDHDRGMPHARKSTERISVVRLAKALRMLEQLREGKSEDLILVGGDVLGWFSAFTDMFLEIDVALLDQNGEELHRANAGKTARLKLMYVPCEIPEADQDPSAIYLREAIDPTELKSHIPPILSGRVNGQALLSLAFGGAFHRLDHTEGITFGNALGGIARTWELWSQDQDLSPEVISLENRSNPNSQGSGLIQTWTNWFPELRHLQGRMQRALKRDLAGVSQLCTEAIDHLEHVCACFICSPTKGSDDHPTNLPAEGFCIPTLMETVIMLGMALSRVTLSPGLFPSRAGILAMYKSQVRKRFVIKNTNATGMDRHKILFGDDWNSNMCKRLENAVAMFSGSYPRKELPDNLMAINHEGMCAYSLMLQRGNKGKPHPDDQVIRVVNGSIQWQQKSATRLCLGPVQPPVGVEDGWEYVECEHLKERIYYK